MKGGLSSRYAQLDDTDPLEAWEEIEGWDSEDLSTFTDEQSVRLQLGISSLERQWCRAIVFLLRFLACHARY